MAKYPLASNLRPLHNTTSISQRAGCLVHTQLVHFWSLDTNQTSVYMYTVLHLVGDTPILHHVHYLLHVHRLSNKKVKSLSLYEARIYTQDALNGINPSSSFLHWHWVHFEVGLMNRHITI